MAKAKKPETKAAAPKKAKDESGAAQNVIEQFSGLSAEARMKLGPQLAAAANKDADFHSTGTPESTAHYDELSKTYDQKEEETDNA